METGKGCLDLEKEVINEGLCTSCGACVSICPYIKVVKDSVAVVEPCGVAEGQCYDCCPRTSTDLASLDRAVFGKERSDATLGTFVSIEIARAADSGIRDRAQYGGVVSALTAFALESGEIGEALLTRPFDGTLMPSPGLVDEGTRVPDYARSNYVASPTLAELNRTAKQRGGTVGVVGLPCQVLALRKMQGSNHATGADGVSVTIGLFCTWALSYRGLNAYLRGKIDGSPVKKLDIPPPPANVFRVETEAGSVEFPLEEIRGFVKPTCSVCFDMTSELADISVGMVEGLQDWNTLIVRTEAGRALVEKARSSGVIETKPLDEARLSHLRDASLQKKKRAVAEIVRRTGSDRDLGYLNLSDAERSRFLQEH